jgi:starvation-inducible DNA-binding protein
VTGRDFYEYHLLFERIYTEVYGSVDDIAEHIKAQDGIAYGSFSQYGSLSSIKDATSVPSLSEMISTLFADINTLIATFGDAFKAAQDANQQGLINFIGGRIEDLQKHRWMLKASMEQNANEERVYILKPE